MKISSIVMLTAVTVLATGCQRGADTATTPSPSSPDVTSASPATADNGVAALSADEILQRAKNATHQAKSFHIKGKTMNGAQTTSADMEVSGADVSGTFSVGAAKVGLLRVGGQQYFRPNEQFWVMSGAAKQAHRIAALVGDRWVRVPASNKKLSSLFDDANIDSMIELDGQLSKGATEQIAGVPTIGLVDADAETTLYVATTGNPYPVRQEGTDGSEMTFSEMGATFADIKAPTPNQVLDLAALTGK